MSWWETVSRPKFLSVAAFAVTLMGGIVIGTLMNREVKAVSNSAVAPDARPLSIPSPTLLATEFTRLAKRLEPTVVNIRTDYTSPNEEDDEEDAPDMLKKFLPNPHKNLPPRMFRREATGSGFFVDPNGYILTNNHVIENAQQIRVKLAHADQEFKAKLIGTDLETDLAVIKIEPHGTILPAKIANSDSVQVGDWAIAIGSPFGLEATVTAGIVSATGRDIDGAQQFQKFIQTDAAINPGNSGGPLLNINGEVIGINTAIATESGGYQGIGFALPVNTAVEVYNSIIRYGRVVRGSIGVRWNKDKSAQTLKGLGFHEGVLIEDVTKNGPADVVGIKPDDVIVAMNNKVIKDGDDLVGRVAQTPIGSSINVTVDRNGERFERKVKIEDRAVVFADDPRFAQKREGKPSESPKVEKQALKPSMFGISIRDLSAAKKAAAGVESGMEVSRVEQDSFAEDIGLQPGDIIVSINRQPVRSLDDIRGLQARLHGGDAVAFRVYRQDGVSKGGGARYRAHYVPGTLPME